MFGCCLILFLFFKSSTVFLDTTKIKLLRGKRPIRVFEKEQIRYIVFVQSEGILTPGYPKVKLSRLDFMDALKVKNESNALTTNSIVVSSKVLKNNTLPDFFTLSNDKSFILFHQDSVAAQWIVKYFKEKII